MQPFAGLVILHFMNNNRVSNIFWFCYFHVQIKRPVQCTFLDLMVTFQIRTCAKKEKKQKTTPEEVGSVKDTEINYM